MMEAKKIWTLIQKDREVDCHSFEDARMMIDSNAHALIRNKMTDRAFYIPASDRKKEGE